MKQPNFYTKKLDQTPTYGKFIIEPLPLSFGDSVGNSLRRTLLSSLQGAVITQIKINGVPHMFSTMKGVKESALELILNLQQLRFETPKEGSFRVHVEEKGEKKIEGKDVKGEVSVINKDAYIGHLTDSKSKLSVEAIVQTGIGSLNRDEIEDKETDFIALDSFFSPVKKVNFKIEGARVGRKTNFDRLILELWTDGTISPEDALKESSEIMANHFNHILSGKDKPESKDEEEEKKESAANNQKLKDIIIDELDLPSRVINALLREDIETIDDLVKVGKEKLIDVKGLGKKSYSLIVDELKKMGIAIDS
ncbi:MAG: DNA-directed RNA polymerase subunit alpha [Patescibacteria group bacterium]